MLSTYLLKNMTSSSRQNFSSYCSWWLWRRPSNAVKTCVQSQQMLNKIRLIYANLIFLGGVPITFQCRQTSYSWCQALSLLYLVSLFFFNWHPFNSCIRSNFGIGDEFPYHHHPGSMERQVLIKLGGNLSDLWIKIKRGTGTLSHTLSNRQCLLRVRFKK